MSLGSQYPEAEDREDETTGESFESIEREEEDDGEVGELIDIDLSD